jgi:alanine dehydrogenase
MLFLSRREVEALLDLDRLIEALGPAMAELSAGRVSQPARIAAVVPQAPGVLGVMPVFLHAPSVLSAKLVSVFPQNAPRGLPSHQALIAVFDAQMGAPRAVMDGTSITALRTAAGSALATQLLARPEAAVMAIVGTGVQARAHARAIPRVRGIREIRVVGRDPAKAVALAKEISHDMDLGASACESVDEALAGAQIVCATTHAAEPVIRGEALEPGIHVNSVGFNTEGREVDGEAVRRAMVVVESRAAVLAPPPAGANDLRWPLRDGVIGENHIHAEIGEIVSGARPGRTSPQQITLYKSVGVAVQDAGAAHLVLEEAAKRGVGREVEI